MVTKPNSGILPIIIDPDIVPPTIVGGGGLYTYAPLATAVDVAHLLSTLKSFAAPW